MEHLQSDILILGEGFGGIYTITELLKNKSLESHNITLIGKNNYFVFTPLLHEVATGGLYLNEITVPIGNLFSDKITYVNGTVQSIDLLQKQVKLDNETIVDFNYIVIATGAKSKTEIIPGATANAYFLKTIDDAKKIKNKLIELFGETTPTHKPLTINVLGGGPTGVELICEIYEYINSTLNKICPIKNRAVNFNLITADNELLKMYEASIRNDVLKYLTKKLKVNVYLNKTCKKINSDNVELDTKIIESSMTIATVGVMPNIPNIISEIELDKANRVVINENLQIPNYDFAYAIGDIAAGYPMDAQVAVKQARVVANNICKAIVNNSNYEKFNYRSMGKFLSLGRGNAAGQILNFGMIGSFVWFIWRTIYLSKMPTLSKKIYISITWALGLFYPRDTTKIY